MVGLFEQAPTECFEISPSAGAWNASDIKSTSPLQLPFQTDHCVKC
jgi:hypothetical protein